MAEEEKDIQPLSEAERQKNLEELLGEEEAKKYFTVATEDAENATEGSVHRSTHFLIWVVIIAILVLALSFVVAGMNNYEETIDVGNTSLSSESATP